ncbi:hypothetical protein LCGC14_2393810, partial [marine sediment metagenome]
LKIIIVFIIAGVLLNDIGLYFYTSYQGQQAARNVSDLFSSRLKGTSSTGILVKQANEIAEDRGARFIGYKFDGDNVTTEVELDVNRTVIIKRVEALKDFTKIRMKSTARIRQ